jgi:hypothetical protein
MRPEQGMLAALLVFAVMAGEPGSPAACAAIEADAARLACYDSIYRDVTGVSGTTGADVASRKADPGTGASSAAAVAAAGSPGTVSAQPVRDPVAEFGLTEQQKADKRSDARPRLQELQAIVREVKKNGVDRWAFHLDNGQVWTQTESTPRQPFKNGDSIRIREAAMSSYLANGPNSGGSVRVRRAR